jgi:hypothetical protein
VSALASLQAELEGLQGKLADARQSLEGNDQMIRWLNNQVGHPAGHSESTAHRRGMYSSVSCTRQAPHDE